MIEDVMTFLPKPERNDIWVFAHDAPDQPRRYAGAAGRNIAGSTLSRRGPPHGVESAWRLVAILQEVL